MIRQKAAKRVRIVLHGTNDFPEDIMKKCIAGGVTKVNVNKLVLDDYLVHIRENSAKLSLTTLMEQGVEAAQKLMEWQMDVVGSTGKA
jgi:fructose-bisphosphate aldolase class II